MTRPDFARASLLLLWWGTVAASLHDGGAAGIALLQRASGLSAGAALALVLLGCAWDAAIGLLILLRPSAPTYRLAAVGVIAMTALATALVPALWLDPFGALLKNLPVLALLALLAEKGPIDMNTYLLIKWLHIVSSVVLVGTGFGSAFYLFFANRSASLEARAVVARLVVRADLWFTTPAVIVQPATGLWLAHTAGWPPTTPWLLASLLLYALAGACWLPVLWLQLKMAREVEAALAQGRALSVQYRRWQAAWEWLGYPAFAAMLAVFFLMVNKPRLWG